MLATKQNASSTCAARTSSTHAGAAPTCWLAVGTSMLPMKMEWLRAKLWLSGLVRSKRRPSNRSGLSDTGDTRGGESVDEARPEDRVRPASNCRIHPCTRRAPPATHSSPPAAAPHTAPAAAAPSWPAWQDREKRQQRHSAAGGGSRAPQEGSRRRRAPPNRLLHRPPIHAAYALARPSQPQPIKGPRSPLPPPWLPARRRA